MRKSYFCNVNSKLREGVRPQKLGPRVIEQAATGQERVTGKKYTVSCIKLLKYNSWYFNVPRPTEWRPLTS